MEFFSSKVLLDWQLPPDVDGDYPPRMSPVFEKVIDEIESNIMAPRGLIIMNILTTMAISAQGRFDVRMPGGPTVPVSLMLMAIAESGERKTAIEKVLLRPIREYQAERDREFDEKIKGWRVKSEVLEERKKCVFKKLRSHPEFQEEVEAELIRMESARPIKPKRHKLLYEDATPEALFSGMARDIPVAGLVSSEGGAILNGRSFRDLEKQNSAWSGASIVVDRKNGESFDVKWLRLTVSMQIQPAPLMKYLDRVGEQSRGIGTWARFLLFEPASNKGYRYASGVESVWSDVSEFNRKVRNELEYLDDFVSGVAANRVVLEFTPQAASGFLSVVNQIEKEMRPGFRFGQATDHASKLAENIARVSALLHVFSGEVGGISCETLKSAIDICFYCSRVFMRKFVPPPREYADAKKIAAWLSACCIGCRYVKINHILQFGPSEVRDSKRLKAAVEVLVGGGVVSVILHEKTRYIDLLPGDNSGYVNSLVWLPAGGRELLIGGYPSPLGSIRAAGV